MGGFSNNIGAAIWLSAVFYGAPLSTLATLPVCALCSACSARIGSLCNLGWLLSRWLIRRELLDWEALRTLPVHLSHLTISTKSQWWKGSRACVNLGHLCKRMRLPNTAPTCTSGEPEGQLAFKRRVSEVLSLAVMDESCKEEKPL